MFKKMMLGLVLVGSMAFANEKETMEMLPKEGDQLVVNAPANNYQYIKAPKLHILAKRGNVATHKNLHNTAVVVTDVKEKKNGTYEVTLKRADGKKFYKSHATIKANFSKALEKGELAYID